MSDKPEHVGLDNKPAVERDWIDLNHEISGEPVGRIQRFLPDNALGVYGENEKKKSERRFRTMLEILLAEDAQYAKLYFEIKETLDGAKRAMGRALIDLNQRLGESERLFRLLQDNAAKLDDGTRVFRSAVDGSIYAENGRKLSSDEARGIEFSEHAPSWEAYKTAKDRLETVKEQKSAVETYQRDVIDRAQERLSDADDPPSLEELEKIERDIQVKKPEVLSQYFYQEGLLVDQSDLQGVTVAEDISGKSPLNMPPMNRQFDIARLGLPDMDTLPQLTKDQTVAPVV